MKIMAIARNAFGGFVRDKIILLSLLGLVCITGLMLTPLVGLRMEGTLTPEQRDQTTISLIEGISAMVSTCGSLLAVWAAADAIAGEIRSGTILAVMARPVERWQYLAGKLLAAIWLSGCYTLAMLGLLYGLAWVGGGHVQCSFWVLIAYPMVRYTVYAAMAALAATYMHPAIVLGAFFVMSTAGSMLSPNGEDWIPEKLRMVLYSVFPSSQLLSESRFYRLNQANLASWSDHLIALTYGVDYALVFFVLAIWVFRKRSLTTSS